MNGIGVVPSNIRGGRDSSGLATCDVHVHTRIDYFCHGPAGNFRRRVCSRPAKSCVLRETNTSS